MMLIVAVLMLSGCITRERCLNRFPPQISDSIQIIRETVETIRDTTITVEIPGEVRLRVDTVYSDPKTGQSKSEKSFLETSLAWSSAEVKDGKLFHELHQRDTTIEFRLENAIREVDRLEKELRQKTTTVEVPRKLTRWQKFAIVWTNFSLGAGFLAIVFLAIKFRSKLPF